MYTDGKMLPLDRNRYRRIVTRGATGIAILLTLGAVLFFSELWRTRAEMNAVLSDLFAVVLDKTPDLGSGRRFRIIIMREAQPPGAMPGETKARWSLLFDRNLRFPQASLVTRGSFLLTNGIPTDIRPTLKLSRGPELVVLRNSELGHMTRDEFLKRFPDNLNWEQFSISQLGLNFSRTEAILYVNHSCPGCGGGSYILMRKMDGVWRIVDEHLIWES